MIVRGAVSFSKILKVPFNLLSFLQSRCFSRDESVWVFGEWYGAKCGDNCAFLANYIASTYAYIDCIWIADFDTDTSVLDSRVQVYEKDSAEAIDSLKRCRVAVVGQNFYDLSSNGRNWFGGAVTINLWHGVPWKKIGHDSNARTGYFGKMYNYFYDIANNADLAVATSPVFDSILETAFGVASHNVIYSGLPRNDRLHDEEFVNSSRTELLEFLGLDVDSKIICYLPTFRDSDVSEFNFSDYSEHSGLVDCLHRHDAVIIQKSHFVYQKSEPVSSSDSFGRILELHNWDVQKLLASTDVLISDYSGAFFDFLILDRPIIHFLYDFDSYRTTGRGLYFERENVVCGSDVDSFESLIDAIDENCLRPEMMSVRRKEMLAKYMTFESQNNCKLIADKLISRL